MMGKSQNTLELAAGMRSNAGVWGWHPQGFFLGRCPQLAAGFFTVGRVFRETRR